MCQLFFKMKTKYQNIWSWQKPWEKQYRLNYRCMVSSWIKSWRKAQQIHVQQKQVTNSPCEHRIWYSQLSGFFFAQAFCKKGPTHYYSDFSPSIVVHFRNSSKIFYPSNWKYSNVRTYASLKNRKVMRTKLQLYGLFLQCFLSSNEKVQKSKTKVLFVSEIL